jgi:hypothetical protein
LTEWEVLEIRELIAEKQLTGTQIGELYGVTKYAVSDIKRRKTWNHI